MATDTRDQRAIALVACPRCNAWAGSPCYHKGEPAPVRHGRPFCHSERRAAWQKLSLEKEKKDGQPIPTIETLALTVPCPNCRAMIGQPCRNYKGEYMAQSHGERAKLAKEKYL